jgi:hypothetical protein
MAGLLLAAVARPFGRGTFAQSLKLDHPYEKLSAGRRSLPLLPGCKTFTFASYGCPGELPALKEYVAAMKAQHIGNGFDPGPVAKASSRPLFEYLAALGWPVLMYPGYGDMQVADGDARLTDEDEQAIMVLARAGIFNGTQLGEWDYYFHNLSGDEGWWREVYGKRFTARRASLKPRGLEGFERRPQSRQEAFDAIRTYYQTRDRAMRGRNYSVTGHSHYEAYAAEWGSPLIGLELGENIGFTQSKIAFARGAARQWQRPFSVQVSPWFHGACTTSGSLRIEGSDRRAARGLDAGHSLSFYQRLWLHAWFAGAAMVTPENSISMFFEEPHAPWRITSHGDAAAKVFEFCQSHERGVPFTPVAIVLDHLTGFNAYKGRPWGIFEPTAGDLEINDLLHRQIWPGADIIHSPPAKNPESGYLRPTPYGEICDVILSNAAAETLRGYQVLLLAGDVSFDSAFIDRLREAAASGVRILIHPRHEAALGKSLTGLTEAGAIEVLEPWVNPETNRPAAISAGRLRSLSEECLPVQVSGAPVQFQVNRTPVGWVVEIVNNDGVLKEPTQPAVVDESATTEVRLKLEETPSLVRELITGESLTVREDTVAVTVPPGSNRFVEIEVRHRADK